MWLQSKLSPVPADPIQAKIMKIMPVAFSIFFFFFPSGLVLYSLCNNILSIAQQWQITRMFERKAEEDAQKDKTRIKGKVKNKPDNGELLLTAPAPSADDKDGGKSEISNDEQSVLSTEDEKKEKSKPGAKPKGKTVVKRARKK